MRYALIPLVACISAVITSMLTLIARAVIEKLDIFRKVSETGN
jgi:hypothetical protein